MCSIDGCRFSGTNCAFTLFTLSLLLCGIYATFTLKNEEIFVCMKDDKNIAAVFPGQGSQRPGMGKDFYEQIPVCRQTFEEAADALGWNIMDMCFGEDERLNLTEYTQPCIVTTEICMLRGLNERYGFAPDYFGGHSLGEFTALVAAGVLPLFDTLKIVQIRGRLMQNAVPVGVGGMAAVISENIDMNMLAKTMEGLKAGIANINSANQVVISGELPAIDEVEKRFTENLNTQILAKIEGLTGKRVDDIERKFIMNGPDEQDLVHSGLEETMITATREIMEIWKANPEIPDMRTAAYVNAINKVATSYAELGIFP